MSYVTRFLPGEDQALGIIPVSPIMAGATSLTLILNSASRVERFFIMPVRSDRHDEKPFYPAG
jgi:hypothetical protein